VTGSGSAPSPRPACAARSEGGRTATVRRTPRGRRPRNAHRHPPPCRPRSAPSSGEPAAACSGSRHGARQPLGGGARAPGVTSHDGLTRRRRGEPARTSPAPRADHRCADPARCLVRPAARRIRAADAASRISPWTKDPGQLAFEIEAALLPANAQYVVSRTSQPIERARRAIQRCLQVVAVPSPAPSSRPPR
jgi:hypothetical protein